MQLKRLMSIFVGLILTTSILLGTESNFKYSYMPKKVYKNQLFPVTIISSSQKSDDSLVFTFEGDSGVKPLFEDPLVVRNGSDSFYTFYFKASKDDVHIPKLHIKTFNNTFILDAKTIFIEKLKEREDFCGVLAADMKIKNSQVSNYDENHHIVTLSLEAFEANIEDIRLNTAQESDIDTLKRNYAKVEAEFYVVLPVAQTSLKFTYFNTIKKQYVYLETPVVVEDATVTTQSELNPVEDDFELFKKYTLMGLLAFFLFMFILKRDFFYLVLGVIALIVLLTLHVPHKKICIKQGASLYILPTQTSTISTKIDHELKTMLLGEHETFKKVEYNKGVIGWIKNEDLCEH